MRKLFSIILSAIMVLTMLPIGASAAETSNPEREALLAMACEAFPEYADKIRNQTINTNALSRTGGKRELIINETRAVSDKEYINYAEYSDGVILLSEHEFENQVTTVDRESSSYAVHVTVNIKATCTGVNGYFALNGVKYSLINGGYDSITDTGTASRSGNCTKSEFWGQNLTETASSSAYLSYHLYFQFAYSNMYTVDSILRLSIKDNTVSITHVDYNDA